MIIVVIIIIIIIIIINIIVIITDVVTCDLSLDIDECVGSPCKNGATCQNIPGSHKCNCKPGFTGRDCGKGELHQNGQLLSTSYLLHFLRMILTLQPQK